MIEKSSNEDNITENINTKENIRNSDSKNSNTGSTTNSSTKCVSNVLTAMRTNKRSSQISGISVASSKINTAEEVNRVSFRSASPPVPPGPSSSESGSTTKCVSNVVNLLKKERSGSHMSGISMDQIDTRSDHDRKSQITNKSESGEKCVSSALSAMKKTRKDTKPGIVTEKENLVNNPRESGVGLDKINTETVSSHNTNSTSSTFPPAATADTVKTGSSSTTKGSFNTDKTVNMKKIADLNINNSQQKLQLPNKTSETILRESTNPFEDDVILNESNVTSESTNPFDVDVGSIDINTAGVQKNFAGSSSSCSSSSINTAPAPHKAALLNMKSREIYALTKPCWYDNYHDESQNQNPFDETTTEYHDRYNENLKSRISKEDQTNYISLFNKTCTAKCFVRHKITNLNFSQIRV